MTTNKTPQRKHLKDLMEEIGDSHFYTGDGTPIREDAFELSEEEKMDKIEAHFKEIMNVIGLDLNDDSLSGTPRRVAKMFVKEIFAGINPDNKPATTLFNNSYQ